MAADLVCMAWCLGPPRGAPSVCVGSCCSFSAARVVRVGGASAPSCRIAGRLVAASRSGASQSSRKAKARVRTSKKSRTKEGDDSAWGASFAQPENDVENNAEDDEDENLTEEELAQFQHELEIALGQYSDPESLSNPEHKDSKNETRKGCSQESKQENDNDEYEQGDTVDLKKQIQKEFEVSSVVRLEKWQLRKLAAALELGRRRVQVKTLAAEVGLDRKDVLSFLKNPPFQLLTLRNLQEDTVEVKKDDDAQVEKKIPVPNAKNCKMQNEDRWGNKPERKTEESEGDSLVTPRNLARKKRIKKQYLATFELVYRRTKRPTNAMIQNMVNLTNVPRKYIVEWFVNRRLQSSSDFTRSIS